MSIQVAPRTVTRTQRSGGMLRKGNRYKSDTSRLGGLTYQERCDLATPVSPSRDPLSREERAERRRSRPVTKGDLSLGERYAHWEAQVQKAVAHARTLPPSLVAGFLMSLPKELRTAVAQAAAEG